MNKINWALLAVLLLFSCTAISQSPNLGNFSPLRSSGTIPPEVLESTFTKIDRAAQATSIDKTHKNKEKSIINQFRHIDQVVQDYLLRSGKVLFNDSISNYVNQVADRVIQQFPADHKPVYVYVLKSPEVNAFSTSPGYIYISIGLLAQLENEAQLAFVLAHEIAHVQKNHGIEQVLNEAKSKRELKRMNYRELDDHEAHIKAFSREDELEADSIGLEILVKAGYKSEGALSIMDVLQLSFMPFSNEHFSYQFLETSLFTVPSWTMLDTARAIPYDTDVENDEYSTHPNINSRREALLRIEEHLDVNGNKYLVSQAEFNNCVNLARFELVYLDLIHSDYSNAIYNANILSQQFPNNRFLEEAMGKALYGIVKYRKQNQSYDAGLKYHDKYGEFQRATYFFSTCNLNSLSVLTLNYLIDLEKKYNNPTTTLLLEDMVCEVTKLKDNAYIEFATKVAKAKKLQELGLNREIGVLQLEADQRARLAVNNSSSEGGLENNSSNDLENKYDQLRKARENKRNKSDSADSIVVTLDDEVLDWTEWFAYLAFDENISEALQNRFDTIISARKQQEEADEAWKNELIKNKAKYKYQGYSLGIDQVTIVEPFYFQVAKKRSKITFINNEPDQKIFIENLIATANETGLKTEVLAWQKFEKEAGIRFGEMSALNDWKQEIKHHLSSDVEMIPVTTDYIKDINEKYGSEVIMFPGMYGYMETRHIKVGQFILCVVFAPLLLYVIPSLIFKAKECYTYYDLYDASTGETVWRYSKMRHKRARTSYAQSEFSNLLKQSHRRAKK